MVAFGKYPWMPPSPSDIGASEKTPQLAGLRVGCEVFTVHRVLLEWRWLAPRRSQGNAERSRGRSSGTSLALWGSSGKIFAPSPAVERRGGQSYNNNPTQAAVPFGEGELSLNGAENKVNSIRCRAVRLKERKWWSFGGGNKTKPFCIRAVLLVDVYAWVLHRMGAKTAPDPPGTSSRSASLLTEIHKGGRAPKAPAKPSALWPTAEW